MSAFSTGDNVTYAGQTWVVAEVQDDGYLKITRETSSSVRAADVRRAPKFANGTPVWVNANVRIKAGRPDWYDSWSVTTRLPGVVAEFDGNDSVLDYRVTIVGSSRHEENLQRAGGHQYVV